MTILLYWMEPCSCREAYRKVPRTSPAAGSIQGIKLNSEAYCNSITNFTMQTLKTRYQSTEIPFQLIPWVNLQIGRKRTKKNEEGKAITTTSGGESGKKLS